MVWISSILLLQVLFADLRQQPWACPFGGAHGFNLLQVCLSSCSMWEMVEMESGCFDVSMFAIFLEGEMRKGSLSMLCTFVATGDSFRLGFSGSWCTPRPRCRYTWDWDCEDCEDSMLTEDHKDHKDHKDQRMYRKIQQIFCRSTGTPSRGPWPWCRSRSLGRASRLPRQKAGAWSSKDFQRFKSRESMCFCGCYPLQFLYSKLLSIAM